MTEEEAKYKEGRDGGREYCVIQLREGGRERERDNIYCVSQLNKEGIEEGGGNDRGGKDIARERKGVCVCVCVCVGRRGTRGKDGRRESVD